jgi:hypothetical protein
MSWRLLLVVLASSLLSVDAMAAPIFYGPTGYDSSKDVASGLDAGGVTLRLEDFEDGSLDFGIVASAGSVYGPGGGADSVDGDDGVIDGSGNGRSWLTYNGVAGVTFTFPSLVKAAGLVFTDGGGAGTFEAFGPGMVSLGSIGPVPLGGVGSGNTFDDRFFGVRDSDGIIAIRLSMSEGGLEVDHLYFGTTPEPGTATLLSLGLALMAGARRRAKG